MNVSSYSPAIAIVSSIIACNLGLSRETAARAADVAAVELEVRAGSCDREVTPVSFVLPTRLAGQRTLRLTQREDGKEVPVQRLDGGESRAIWIVDGKLRAGQSRRYLLGSGDHAPSRRPSVACNDDGKQLVIRAGNQSLLAYNHAEVPSPPGMDSVYAKSAYLHPFSTPAGRWVTDDFPPDHAHQHGIFFAWVNTSFRGHAVDFWNQPGRTGRVRHERIEAVASGPVFAEFTVVMRHEDITGGNAEPVLEELWTLRAYAAGNTTLVDLDSIQTCIATSPLTVNEFHYGGLAVRGARDWFKQPSSDFLTSEGKIRSNGNHTRARWVIAHGRTAGQPAGICVLGHSENFRAPQPVRLHPDKPYFCFSPMVLGAFTIEPGKPYKSRYRFAAFDGPPSAEMAERLWRDFAEPAEVRLVD